jgi:hypothetical protein
MDTKPGVARDFVYAGKRRAVGGGALEVWYLLNDGDSLDERMLFKAERKSKVIGGVYTGARFDDGKAYDVHLVSWKRRWGGNQNTIAQWQAEEYEFEREGAVERMEKEHRAELEKSLLPFRRKYHALQASGKWVQARVYQEMIASLIAKPPTSKEEV